jgi:hypothetical protein
VCDGFRRVDIPPSPNDQFHEVEDPVEESVNWTAIGGQPAVMFAVKFATGGGGGTNEVTVIGRENGALDPYALDEVKLTV